MFEASEKLLFADIAPALASQPVWALTDANFEVLLDRFREHRRRGSSAERPHPDPGDDRSQLHLLFMQHGLRFGGAGVRRHFAESRQRSAG